MPLCTGSVSIGSLMPKFCLLKPVLGAGYSPWVRARSGISRHRCCRYQGRRANLTFAPNRLSSAALPQGWSCAFFLILAMADPGLPSHLASVLRSLVLSSQFLIVRNQEAQGSPEGERLWEREERMREDRGRGNPFSDWFRSGILHQTFLGAVGNSHTP